MKVSGRKMLYEVHSWTGVGFGIILFVTCFTGTLTVFRDEIRVWSNPFLSSIDYKEGVPMSVDRAVATFSGEYDLGASLQWAIRLPGCVNPAYELLIPSNKRQGLIHAYAHPLSADFIGESKSQVADFIFQLHSNLASRSKLGRYLVGVGGIALLMSITTGVLFHQRLLRGLFTMRWTRRLRVAVSDTHQSIAVWALVFHIVIAFTGAFLALKNLLILLPALAEQGGDFSAAQKMLSGPRVKPLGEAARMASVDDMLSRARKAVPGFVPTLLVFRYWGDAHARIVIAGSLSGHLLPKNEAVRMTFDAVSGEQLKMENGLERSGWRRVYDAMMPLHYGDFGGIGLQVIYFLLGISTTTLTWTGLVIWIERRRQQRALSQKRAQALLIIDGS